MDHLVPLYLLQAERRYHQALRNCVHWSVESNGTSGEPCCIEVAESEREKETARRALSKQLRS